MMMVQRLWYGKYIIVQQILLLHQLYLVQKLMKKHRMENSLKRLHWLRQIRLEHLYQVRERLNIQCKLQTYLATAYIKQLRHQ